MCLCSSLEGVIPKACTLHAAPVRLPPACKRRHWLRGNHRVIFVQLSDSLAVRCIGMKCPPHEGHAGQG